MNKNEFYAAIILISLVLISVLWKAEVQYRLSTLNDPIDIPTHDLDSNYTYSDWMGSPKKTKNLKNPTSKNKTHKKSWMEAYEDGIIFNYKPRWNP